MAAVLFLCIAGFYWKLTLTRQFDWMSGPDLAEQVLPWFQVQAHEWHVGRFPLWDPYLWAGQPLFGQAQPGAAYPLNWLLFLLPLQNGHIAGWALAWYFVVIHLMAAWFSYLLCRDLGRSRAASLAGGLIFSLSGYLGNTSWPQMMNGAVWAPLVFLFQFRAARGLRPRPTPRSPACSSASPSSPDTTRYPSSSPSRGPASGSISSPGIAASPFPPR